MDIFIKSLNIRGVFEGYLAWNPTKLSLSTLLTQRFCKDLVVNFVSQCALSCILEFVKKGHICFSVSESRYVCYDGAYVRQSGTDGAPIARILTVYQVLQGRRCYPHNSNIKCNLLFSEHSKRAKRKAHMREKNKRRFIKNSSLKTNSFLDRNSN